jgi:hypothetical protein
MSSDDPITRAEQLLAEVEAARAELEHVAAGSDPDKALEVLDRLAELAKQVEEELQRAQRESEADAGS